MASKAEETGLYRFWEKAGLLIWNLHVGCRLDYFEYQIYPLNLIVHLTTYASKLM